MLANANLILHAGARRVSMDELVEIPAPEPTRSWFPIPHYRVLDSVQCALHEAGFAVKRMDLGVSENGHKFFGVIDLASTIIEGVSLAVGVRNSTDKSLPAGIAAGERVLVCDNLAFAATIVIMRKHTRRILDELDDRIISVKSIPLSKGNHQSVELQLPRDLNRKNASIVGYIQDSRNLSILGATSVDLESAPVERVARSK